MDAAKPIAEVTTCGRNHCVFVLFGGWCSFLLIYLFKETSTINIYLILCLVQVSCQGKAVNSVAASQLKQELFLCGGDDGVSLGFRV